MLISLGYRRQVNRKTKEGGRHPDRDGQFQHINRQATAFQAAGQPVISVDTKKKELIGECKNGDSDYHAMGCPRSTSSFAPRGMEAICVRRARLSTASNLPDALSLQAPSISMRAWRGFLAAGRVSSLADMSGTPRLR